MHKHYIEDKKKILKKKTLWLFKLQNVIIKPERKKKEKRMNEKYRTRYSLVSSTYVCP